MMNKEKYLQKVNVIIMSLGIAFFMANSAALAITTSDWVTKAQSYMNARDNGKFTATKNLYLLVNGTNEALQATATIWFQDDVSNGWSYREDTNMRVCGNWLTVKVLSVPSGYEEFVDGTEVYPDKDSVLVGSFGNQSHGSIPKIFYDGDPSQSAEEALDDLSTSITASTEYLDSIYCYKIEITWNINGINSQLKSAYQLDSEDITQLETTLWVKESNGEPVKGEVEIDDSDGWRKYRWRWSNINTDPTIPSGTFDLTAGNPDSASEDVFADWIETNCPE